MSPLRFLGLMLASALAGACGGGTSPADAAVDAASDADVGVDADAEPGILADDPRCDNTNPILCTLPYPSSHFLEEDATTETGYRVHLEIPMMPTNQFGEEMESTRAWNLFDGFSPSTSLMAGFEGKIDDTPLADEEHIDDSLLPDSATVIIDAATGERVAHWAEVDKWTNGDPLTTTFYLRPAVRLEENRRYLVAIRGLDREDGTPLPPSLYFAALRDGTETEVASLEARRPAMDTLFDDLEAAGVPRAELILAWEFHTASGESLWGDLVGMRNDAFARFDAGTDGVGGCTVERVEEDVNDEIYRRVTGTFTVPLYMTTPYEGALANRGADGEVEYNGTAEAPFEVVIPRSVEARVREGRGRAPGLMYGHGLLGSASQVSSGGPVGTSQRGELVPFGTSYWGLSSDDTAQILTFVVTSFDNMDQVGERLMQGTINSLLVPKVFRGGCNELPELMIDVDGEARPVLSQDETYYYGISQGGIMGATVAALTDVVDAFVLQVGATTYSTMLRRSRDFGPYEAVLAIWYRSKLERDWLVVSTQTMWDLAEPATYAGHILSDPLPGVDTPRPRVLSQVSRYDIEVNNAASDIAARTMGLPVLRSSVYEPWNVDAVDGDVPSAYVIYHLDDVEPQLIGTREPRGDNSAHGDLRFLEPVLAQIDAFLMPDGQVVDTCPRGTCLIPNTRR